MNSITITAPAKINLMLDVTGKRPDGYHELVTVMQSISLSDTVFVQTNNSGEITVDCKGVQLNSVSDNIAFKAVTAFYGHTKISCTGLHILIDKQIPLQAGLGGGSADGAAVLIALNKIHGFVCASEELCEIGVKLGADVPFCLTGGTKLCRGIGEEISYVPPLESCFIVVAKGTAGISTKKAYQKIDGLASRKAADISLYDGTVGSLKKLGGNIFEEVADNGDVSKIKQILTDFGAEYSAMSGSGSAVFGIFREGKSAENVCKALRLDGYFAEKCIPLSYGAKIFDR
ncbi:MAG: 4-(cytidine 5'-diphospho)-2-C-methyl-D-erythritol kinase [Ruminococcus sp.]|nr:4-(cytidine 5'-diphospho)-2-C-methyl-D-erythritol kinase [Ruminococcus sp.]MCM1478553.1 4-(cytidine 5'-diphospho)-2-C-methyl-D-erythritol kinase [Muribaculaceae bacterium]